ncbi:hypothetical protein QR680_001199 [Steinernema hermaphroditum]|uniref:Uncharacterized protein n=1 Tax=Steinernema hermaphroditum TaxID=289476 RepID=A0AA39H036_9BILA|nr:hypothetical protein QR680_001199 [Steinernema hermaphroditum]
MTRKDHPSDRLQTGIEVPPTFSKKKKGKTKELPIVDDDYEDTAVNYEPSCLDKFFNVLLCRFDLANQKLEARPVSVFGLFRYANTADYALLIVGVICSILSGASLPVLAIINGRIANVLMVVDHRSDEFRRAGYENVYIFIGVGCFTLIVNYAQYMCFQTVCVRVISKLRHNYLKAILRQNAGWFDKNHSGTLTTRLNDNIERIREGIGDKLGLLLRAAAMLAVAIAVAFSYEWRLALMMLGVSPATCIVMSVLAQRMGAITQRELQGVAKAGAIAEESVLGVRTVQAFNGQETIVKRYEEALSHGKKFGIQKSVWSGVLGGLFFFILYAFLGSGLLYGGWLLKVGIFTNPGEIFTVIFSMLLGAYFLGLVSPHLMVLLSARVAAGSIYSTIDRRPKIDVYSEEGRRLKDEDVEGRVEFKGVHFRYPTRKEAKVLNGLNLVIEPGQTVALVGHSGCGKSTSVGLLTRLYECEAGEVLLDGADVKSLNIQWLRNVVGIVQQEPILFNDTIEENLKFGFPECSRERMVEVCKMANAHDFIMKLPKGYETRIGEGGVQLSGGQKQRIAIARTLARDPKVLLLDEATSALDAQSESIVQEALNNASRGRSTIVIAHRLSTVRDADKIVVFEKGQIAEQGTHRELFELGGRYADLVKAQQFQPETIEEEDEDQEIDLERDERQEGVYKAVPIQYPHESVQYDEVPFDDITPAGRRESFTGSNFGRESFVRGSTRGAVSSVRSSFASAIMLSAEHEAFAHQVEKEMADDGKIKAGLFTVYRHAEGNYTLIVICFFLNLVRSLQLPALALIMPESFRAFIMPPDDMVHQLVKVCIIFSAVGLGIVLFQALSTVLCGIISERLTLSFRVRALRNILYQDAAYFDNPQHTAGKLITRLATDAPNVKALIDSRMLQVVYCVASLLTEIIICFIYSWQIAIVGTGLAFLLGIMQIVLAHFIQKRNMDLIKNDEAGRVAIEIIENVRTIQLLTREGVFYERYEQCSKGQKWNEMGRAWLEAANYSISQTFQYFMTAVTYALGIHVISMGQKSPDHVFQGIVAMMMAAVAVMDGAAYFPEFVKARTASGMLFSMIFRKPKTGDSSVGEKMNLQGNIHFKHVKFTYPQRPRQPVMTDLNFNANRGQTVALVGPSGSGKSTVISMIERFYDPTGGAVLFDGRDLKELSLDHFRTQVALVGQEPRLFAGTIKENICFGLGDTVSGAEVDKAVELANAKRFLSNLPQGLDTEVGEKGTQMSGGQKQRIAIARALVRNPKILLLDEATSALDSESERAVQQALDNAREGRTCITIAHRLSSIQNSDLILFIENGKVRESGNHSSLMAKKGKYYDLIKKQDLN